jgi:hypothetical protein
MITDLFEDDKPCPSEIEDCDKLREQYKKDISAVNPKTCKPCVINSIKNKYLNIIASKNR